MKKILIIVLFPLLMLSCKQVVCNSSGSNSIRYIDFAPDTIISSVDSSGYDTANSCYYPCPINNTRQMLLDVDNDGSNDFEISVNHSKNADTTLCGIYSTMVRIYGTKSGNSVAVNSGTKMVTAYDMNESISGEWSDDATINVNPNLSGNSFKNGSNYIAFKILKDGGTLHMGWIRLDCGIYSITIQDMGYNDAGGNCVKAGEL